MYPLLVIETSEAAARRELGVIRVNLQISKQQRLAARFVASTVGLYGHKHGVDLFERLGIVELQNPSLFRCVVFKKNPKIQSLLHVRATPAPRLERSCIPYAGLLVQIVGVEDQGLSFRVRKTRPQGFWVAPSRPTS